MKSDEFFLKTQKLRIYNLINEHEFSKKLKEKRNHSKQANGFIISCLFQCIILDYSP